MKKKSTPKGLMLTGSLRKSGVTMYQRGGKVIVRTATSIEKRSNTLGQFKQRQKMRHTIALWQMLKESGTPLFTERRTAYQGFASLANRLPAVYVPKSLNDASLLLPEMPVSGGTLPTVKQQLDEVDGAVALRTNLRASDLLPHEELRLYTAMQRLEGKTPRVRFKVRRVELAEFTEVDGCLALVDNVFADEQKGWALVRVVPSATGKSRCSSQGLVTRCTYYLQYTTDDALRTAAQSYGGLTE